MRAQSAISALVLTAAVAVTVLSSCVTSGSSSTSAEAGARTAAPIAGSSSAGGGEAVFNLQGVTNLTRVAQLTGAQSINKTNRVGVYGADLGSIFSFEGRHYFVFGDTFGFHPSENTGPGGSNWRSNVMAYTNDTTPSNGITFTGWITNKEGIAKELLSSKKIDNVEITVIPTYGVSVGSKMYLFYMSVNHWGAPGNWYCNYAGLAESSDGGHTWHKLKSPRWPGKSNFVQMAVYRVGGTLYIWSIPAGRLGGVALMKVPADQIENMSSYRYFSGMYHGEPRWSAKMGDRKLVVLPPVGELSVIKDRYLGAWIMTDLNHETHNLQIREGLHPWGPWSPPHKLVSALEYPGLYGAFLSPEYVGQNGKIIYFTMSQWRAYNVFWMKAELVKNR